MFFVYIALTVIGLALIANEIVFKKATAYIGTKFVIWGVVLMSFHVYVAPLLVKVAV